MSRKDIMRLAHEANLPACHLTHPVALARFAALVAAAERTRLHDKFMELHKSQQHSNNYWHFAARKIKEEA